MNTFLSRLNTIFAFALSVLASLTFLCFLTTVFDTCDSRVEMKTVKAVVKTMPDYTAGREEHDLGIVSFDLQANLSHLFNWNVKQLFIYLTAEYKTDKNAVNQVVLWDKIVERGENAVLDYKSIHTKYYFYDNGHGLKSNSNITLFLSWNVIPNAGIMPNIIGTGRHQFQFPDHYFSGRF